MPKPVQRTLIDLVSEPVRTPVRSPPPISLPYPPIIFSRSCPFDVGMSSIAEELALLPQIVSDTHTTNYLTLAAFVVFLYDMIITFPDELELVWKARWSSGKILFIANRYPVFLVSVFLMICASSTICSITTRHSNCVASNYIEAWTMLVFIIPVQIILLLRTNALWGKSRTILSILLGTLFATDVTIIISISLITKSLSFEDRSYADAALGCFGNLNSISTTTAIPSWVALMVFDTIVFLLTVTRVSNIRRAKKDGSRLLHILFRDGIMFYLIMLASSVANLIIYASLPVERRGLVISLIPLLRTVMSVCTARLLLNLRAASVRQGRTLGGSAHWAFGELGTGYATATGGSATLVHLDAAGIELESRKKMSDLDIGVGDVESETPGSFLPPASVESGWTRAGRGTNHERVTQTWSENQGRQHPYAIAVGRQAIVRGEREREGADAGTLALLRGEINRYPTIPASLSTPNMHAVTNVYSGTGEHDVEARSRDRERRGNRLSQVTSAATSIPSSFRAAVLQRFSSIANAPFEAEMQPRAI